MSIKKSSSFDGIHQDLLDAQKMDDDLIIYSLVPAEAAQGWRIDLLELSRAIPSHYHKMRRQIFLVAEGELSVSVENREPTILKSGQLMVIDSGNLHSLHPIGTSRFFDIDFPGFHFPEDLFNKNPPILDPKYFGAKLDLGEYSVYEIANGNLSLQKWSVALLEIGNSPKHFHRIEKEVFIVAQGVLDIEIDGECKLLKVGESIEIFPGQIHQLKSALDQLVRVLCFSFPAFDPKDMYFVSSTIDNKESLLSE